MIRLSIALCLALVSLDLPTYGQESAQRKFIIAAFQLDVDAVTASLKDKSISVNAPFGRYDQDAFRDKWTLGYSHLGSENWTALCAVVSASRYDDPPEEIPNTTKGLENSLKLRREYSKEILETRERKRLSLVKLLLANGADINVADGKGATPLYEATYLGHEEVALLLIECGAKVNSKTGVYIDGTGGITPLHRAVGMPKVVAALLEKNADKKAKDSAGDTPLDWAVRDKDEECIKLLK